MKKILMLLITSLSIQCGKLSISFLEKKTMVYVTEYTRFHDKTAKEKLSRYACDKCMHLWREVHKVINNLSQDISEYSCFLDAQPDIRNVMEEYDSYLNKFIIIAQLLMSQYRVALEGEDETFSSYLEISSTEDDTQELDSYFESEY